jgi:trans-2,3-dihydro-3-hydroxyanthranilate isomerase
MLSTLLVCMSVVVSTAAAREPAEPNPARTYRYSQWDVFTEKPLTGNQLAVFMEPQGLTKALMQNIAREMAFSETTFIFPADDEEVDFRVRIFGPNRELPFAGHPTIGTAFALARAGSISPGTEQVVFSEGIGPVIVELEWDGDDLRFAWMHDLAPTFGKTLKDVNSVAVALGVKPPEIKSTLLPLQEVSGGASFLFVPLLSRVAVDRAKLNTTAISKVFKKAGLAKQSVFIFTTESTDDGATVFGRKLGLDGREDPATGSAAGPLGGYLVRYGVVRDKEAGRILIRQGVQMGRPSWLHVRLGLSGNEITEVRIGGSSVFVGDGAIMLPDD